MKEQNHGVCNYRAIEDVAADCSPSRKDEHVREAEERAHEDEALWIS